MHTAYTVV